MKTPRIGQRGGLTPKDKLVAAVGSAQSSYKPLAEHPSEDFHRQKKGVLGTDPALMIGRQSACWNQAMHVGMQRQILSPGAEDAEKTDLGSQMLRIGSQIEPSFRAGAEQQVVDHLGVPLAEWIEFLGEGKDHREIGDAEQFLFSRGQPALTRLGLALGTVPVAAGVIRDGLMAALRTSIDVTAER